MCNTIASWYPAGREAKNVEPETELLHGTGNYFEHFKDGLILYRMDERYPIGYNLAERHVRPFTVTVHATPS